MDQTTLRIALADVSEDTLHKAMLGDDPIVLVRRGDTVRAYAGTCPHAGAPLEQGALCGERLVCPWHKAVFALKDGALLEPPALAPLTRYEVTITDGVAEITGATLPAPAAGPPTAAPDTIAIIGAGAAAAAAIAHLTTREVASRIVVIGREPKPPYDRTALSKMVIAGEMDPASVNCLPADAFSGAVERIVGEVVRLDAAAHRIHLADGTAIPYDRALVATGGVARRPDFPGIDLAGVHVLRSSEDAASLVTDIEDAREAVLLGASFISLEVASGLRSRGIGVTVVSDGAIPFARQFGEQIGARLKRLHEEKGVMFHTGQVKRFEGDQRVSAVAFDDGTQLACDLVLLGTGVAPAAGFVEGARVEHGALDVDAHLLAAPDLYAAGDIARFPYKGQPTRIEHWRLAQQHGWLAARNILGDDVAFDGVPFFWTAQHGVRIDYLGHAAGWDEIVIDGDLDALDFLAFAVKDGHVAAVIACARDTAMAKLAEAMRHDLTLAEAKQTGSAP